MDLDDDKTAVHDTQSWKQLSVELAKMTTEECATLLAAPHPVVILPVGSTEPHGPHLPLATDAILAEECARRGARQLRAVGVGATVAPAVHYGVTRYAEGFAGTVSISAAVLEQLLRELCSAYREAGFALVCVTNHHLEPAHVEAIGRAVDGTHAARGGVIFANQLSKRWGRTLSDEFKRGDCHAGSYETSLVMASQRNLVRESARVALPSIGVSLSAAIRDGKQTFREIGLDRAYTGSPAEATETHGDEMYARLAHMIMTEVREALGLA